MHQGDIQVIGVYNRVPRKDSQDVQVRTIDLERVAEGF